MGPHSYRMVRLACEFKNALTSYRLQTGDGRYGTWRWEPGVNHVPVFVHVGQLWRRIKIQGGVYA
eukprot:7555548-Lingulodinium_polyedra.AAC.1